jgi:hypothetical protein
MIYSNLPSKTASGSSSDLTNKNLNQYNDVPIQLDNETLTAMKGLLSSKGFSPESAENISITIMIQAKRDNFNPMNVLDSMKNLGEIEMSQLVSEILNFNRFKTSVLGSVQATTPVDIVKRNILA